MLAGEAVRNVFTDVRVKLVKLKDWGASQRLPHQTLRISQRFPGDCKASNGGEMSQALNERHMGSLSVFLYVGCSSFRVNSTRMSNLSRIHRQVALLDIIQGVGVAKFLDPYISLASQWKEP